MDAPLAALLAAQQAAQAAWEALLEREEVRQLSLRLALAEDEVVRLQQQRRRQSIRSKETMIMSKDNDGKLAELEKTLLTQQSQYQVERTQLTKQIDELRDELMATKATASRPKPRETLDRLAVLQLQLQQQQTAYQAEKAQMEEQITQLRTELRKTQGSAPAAAAQVTDENTKKIEEPSKRPVKHAAAPADVKSSGRSVVAEKKKAVNYNEVSDNEDQSDDDDFAVAKKPAKKSVEAPKAAEKPKEPKEPKEKAAAEKPKEPKEKAAAEKPKEKAAPEKPKEKEPKEKDQDKTSKEKVVQPKDAKEKIPATKDQAQPNIASPKKVAPPKPAVADSPSPIVSSKRPRRRIIVDDEDSEEEEEVEKPAKKAKEATPKKAKAPKHKQVEEADEEDEAKLDVTIVKSSTSPSKRARKEEAPVTAAAPIETKPAEIDDDVPLPPKPALPKPLDDKVPSRPAPQAPAFSRPSVISSARPSFAPADPSANVSFISMGPSRASFGLGNEPSIPNFHDLSNISFASTTSNVPGGVAKPQKRKLFDATKQKLDAPAFAMAGGGFAASAQTGNAKNALNHVISAFKVPKLKSSH